MNFLQLVIIFYPMYFILGYFIWSSNKNKGKQVDDAWIIEQNRILREIEKKFEEYVSFKDLKPVEKNVDTAHTKIDTLDKKFDKEITEVKVDVQNTKLTLQERIEMEIEKSIRLRTYIAAEKRDKLDMKIMEDNLRKSIDMYGLDQKMIKIVNDELDVYFKNTYLARKEAYDISTGMFNMPTITEKTKSDDIQNIYNDIMDILDKRYLKAHFDYVYDLSKEETRVFLIEKYIIPPYADRLERMIDDWQNIQRAKEEESLMREQEYQAKKAKEAEEKERASSELGKFESKIDELYKNITKSEVIYSANKATEHR